MDPKSSRPQKWPMIISNFRAENKKVKHFHANFTDYLKMLQIITVRQEIAAETWMLTEPEKKDSSLKFDTLPISLALTSIYLLKTPV